jgi:hypothetical protein
MRERRGANWVRHMARQQEGGRIGYSLEVEVLADGEEDWQQSGGGQEK